ncbi:MAG: T9SS type A sorting domain-containing protein [Saprospiraceae bacterium]
MRYLLLFFSMLLVQEMTAQCTTFAGTPPNFALEICQSETGILTAPSDMVNDGNDVFFYTIHPGMSWDTSVVLTVPASGIFPGSLLTPEVIYNVSLIMGNPASSGPWIVDSSDVCISIIQMGTILVHAQPNLDCIAQGIVCGQPEMQISCTGLEQNQTYVWSGPSGIVYDVAEPQILEEGTYCVTVTSEFGCSSVKCINAVLDPTIPGSTITPPDPELCLDTFFVTGFSIPPNSFPQQWIANGGGMVIDTFGNFIRATGAGEYCVIHTNPANNCADTACVDVPIWGDPPVADAGPSHILSCAPGDTVQLGGPNTSLGPQFTYEWTCVGCPSFPPTPNLTVNESGNFYLTVTDINTGCLATSTTYVQDEIFFDFSTEPAVCPGDSAIIFAGVSSGNPPYNIYIGLNGDTVFEFNNLPPTNLLQIPVTEPTVFEIWATDAMGCDTPEVYSLPIIVDSLGIDFTIETDGCTPVTISASLTNNVPNNSFLINWSTGDVGPTTSVTNTGWYYLTVLDAFDCDVTDSVFVTVDYSGICSYIEGTVTWDTLENCLLDAGEPALAGWLVQAIDGNKTFYGTTDANGYYNIPVEPGDYTVSLVPLNSLWGICQFDVLVSLPNLDETATVDFLAFKIPTCPLLTIDISTPRLRRCFGGNFYNVNFCNEGTAPATNAYVEIIFDEYLTLDASSIPSTDLGNNTYQFNVGDLDVGECGSFWTLMTVSCDAVLGETHCTEAHIYPDTLCLPPNAMWSGAAIDLNVSCTDSVRFTITNVGTAAMTNPLEYVVIEDIVMYMQAPPPNINLGAGDSYEVVVSANGSTWRLEVEQEPFFPTPSYPVATIEGCGTNADGSFSTGFVNLFPLGDPETYLDIDCTENVGGCDPNGKYAYPTGVYEDHFIEQNKDIEYIIRFQNTGTDTAFNVVIRDTLSPFLDVASVRPGASSHPYQFEVYGPGILRFSFPNIQLPDSTTNEPASNGYVTYRISQKPNAPIGSVIENEAAIYFDFNEPIITNVIFHTIGEDFIEMVNDVNDWSSIYGELIAYPNPSGGDVYFELPTGLQKKALFKLQDALGRQLLTAPFTDRKYRFERGGFAAGIYFYQVEIGGASTFSGKIILK